MKGKRKEFIPYEYPKTIKEAISNLQRFFECDMWYAKGSGEWETENDMLKYLDVHFKILFKEIQTIKKKTGRYKYE